jgi:hypothetical protein
MAAPQLRTYRSTDGLNELSAGTALIRGLRRPRDEPQLTRALAATFQADPRMAAQFVETIVRSVADGRIPQVPAEMKCSAEELVAEGRLDLRFTAEDWDVIVELKLYASYGRNQLERYLGVLRDVDSAYVTAVTRSVPRYGESGAAGDPRWLGSVQWRRLLPALRSMQSGDTTLGDQWRLFLDVLEEEGSMGFTKPQPDLFRALERVRVAGKHIEEFVRAVQLPLYEALLDALGGDETSAAIYRTRGGGLYVGKSWNGIIETAFRIPPTGPPAVRAGVFGFNPPVRFFVAPHQGRRWAARVARLEPEAQAAVRFLIERGFRDHDLHAFLELDDDRLVSPTLEEDIVEWAHDRFSNIAQSGLLVFMVGAPETTNGPEQDAAEADEPSA